MVAFVPDGPQGHSVEEALVTAWAALASVHWCQKLESPEERSASMENFLMQQVQAELGIERQRSEELNQRLTSLQTTVVRWRLQMWRASCLQPLAEGCMEVERKRLQMLDGSCLQDLAKRCTEVGRKLLHMLDASCLQPLPE